MDLFHGLTHLWTTVPSLPDSDYGSLGPEVHGVDWVPANIIPSSHWRSRRAIMDLLNADGASEKPKILHLHLDEEVEFSTFDERVLIVSYMLDPLKTRQRKDGRPHERAPKPAKRDKSTPEVSISPPPATAATEWWGAMENATVNHPNAHEPNRYSDMINNITRYTDEVYSAESQERRAILQHLQHSFRAPSPSETSSTPFSVEAELPPQESSPPFPDVRDRIIAHSISPVEPAPSPDMLPPVSTFLKGNTLSCEIVVKFNNGNGIVVLGVTNAKEPEQSQTMPVQYISNSTAHCLVLQRDVVASSTFTNGNATAARLSGTASPGRSRAEVKKSTVHRTAYVDDFPPEVLIRLRKDKERVLHISMFVGDEEMLNHSETFHPAKPWKFFLQLDAMGVSGSVKASNRDPNTPIATEDTEELEGETG